MAMLLWGIHAGVYAFRDIFHWPQAISQTRRHSRRKPVRLVLAHEIVVHEEQRQRVDDGSCDGKTPALSRHVPKRHS